MLRYEARCKMCGKALKNNASLLRHLYRCQGERPPLTVACALVIRSTVSPGKVSMRGANGESIRDAIGAAGFLAGDLVEIRLVRRGQ